MNWLIYYVKLTNIYLLEVKKISIFVDIDIFLLILSKLVNKFFLVVINELTSNFFCKC